MIEILGCLLTIGVVTFATATIGRLVGISLTAVGSGLMALLMPPVFSFRVDSNAGIAALIVNCLAGLLVVHTIRPRAGSSRVTEQVEGRVEEPLGALHVSDGPPLAEHLLRMIEQDAVLGARATDISIQVDANARLSMETEKFDQIITYILRIAFNRPNVHRVHIYACRRPDEERIRIAAEYATEQVFPRLRITGRADDLCEPLALPHWSGACSATWFDNGAEFVYQVRMKRG